LRWLPASTPRAIPLPSKNDRLSEIEAKEVPDGARKKGNEIRKTFDFGMLEYEGLGTASYKTEDYNYKNVTTSSSSLMPWNFSTIPPSGLG